MKRKQHPKEVSKLAKSPGSDVESRTELKSDIDQTESNNFLENPTTLQICHLCLCKSENYRPLFEKSSKTLLKNIRTMLQIEPIRDEAVPDQICIHCIGKIKEFITFREMVVENHRKLQLEVEEAKQVVLFEPFIKMEVVEIEKEDHEENVAKLPQKRNPRQKFRQTSAKKIPKADRDDNYDVLLREYFTFECTQCDQTFPRFYALRRHVVNEHNLDQLSIKCYHSDCNVVIGQRYKIIDHLRRHGDLPSATDFQFHCKTCGKSFEHRSLLEAHLKRDSCTPLPKPKFECHYCSAFYELKGQLKHHFQRNHGFQLFAWKHKCKECGKRLVTKHCLSQHIKICHEQRELMICHICAKSFTTKRGFMNHYEGHHAPTPRATFFCEVCGKALRSKAILSRHMKQTHLEQPMKCEICSKVLRNRGALMNHKRRTHETPKHICPECAKPFRRKEKLVQHLSVHGLGGERYKCEWCDRTFNFSSSKSLHKKTQHPVEWLQSRDETYRWNTKIQQQTN